MSIRRVLEDLSFGQRVAEEEEDHLTSYFVETDHWRKLLSDSVDVIYGPKGSGKSALYFLLASREDNLFDDRILLVPAENPRGATAFQTLTTDPPLSQQEFLALWKLYLVCLASNKFADLGINNSASRELQRLLVDSNLVTSKLNLQRLLQVVFDYIKRFRPTSVEPKIKLDPMTQVPTEVSAKILFGEPTIEQATLGRVSIEHLLELVDSALEESQYQLWILLDRLDVAFSENADLEQNALRALFQVYLDIRGYKRIKLKIFLRTDIWRRITQHGFREASHITKHLTINWDRASLLNLVVRRAAQNESLLELLNVTRDSVLLDANSQEEFFYKVFPDQVEVGERKPNTFDWMLGRTCDGSKRNAPRELIHLLNSLRDVQVRRLEVGNLEPEGARLFARVAFKEALKEVSKVRLEQTLYAEYPELRDTIEKLRGQKTEHGVNSLSGIWQLSEEATVLKARSLVEIGFFEERKDKSNSPIFWVPLLYRDSLDLVQGAAS